jgi:hypothetical protein
MISTRYAVPTIVLLALALVPTTIHTYVGAEVTDGLKTTAIPGILDGMPSAPTERRQGWMWNNFQSTDWIERSYKAGNQDVLLFVARSFDAKRLYHHPELAALRGTETKPAGVTRLAARPDVPLHVLRTSKDNRRGVGVYALLYNGRFIDDPITFQLRTSLELLVSGRKPMTLFLASDLSGDPRAVDRAPATQVLLAALASFESQGVSR